MAGTFITPTAIKKDFEIQGKVCAEVIKESVSRGISATHLRIHGRKTGSGEVGIYGVLTRKAQLTIAPAILIVQDFTDGADTTLARYFVDKGYVTLTVDLAGATGFNLQREVKGVYQPYTLYPEDVSYAVYDSETENKTVAEDVRFTCWYEWGRVIRYAAAYLTQQPSITKAGVIGIGAAATPLWQVLSVESGISAAVVVGNAGWKGYRGILKFGDEPEPQFGDDALKYLAGVEPQAYASHVKCPLMLLAPTNSPVFDLDRAYDTVQRVSDKIYTATDYSVGGRTEVSYECFCGAAVFLDAFLLKDERALAGEIGVKCNVADGKIVIEVTPDVNGLKELCVYVAEEELNPALRAWRKVVGVASEKKGTYFFEYTPYGASGAITFFARAGYDDGMHVCSGVVCRKFGVNEAGRSDKRRVLYSSLVPDVESAFYPLTENASAPSGINLDKRAGVKVKNGPSDLSGITCDAGILTFRVNAKKYKPTQGAMFMVDACVKEGGTFYVTATTDYYGQKTEYVAQIKVFADLWQNVKIEAGNFKTAEGKSLKSYDNVQVLSFSADGEFLINNLLWV